MHYKMEVIIAPTKESGDLNEPERTMILDARFAKREDTYGNGHYLRITGNDGFRVSYDIRYDRDFRPNRKVTYLLDWANYYWSGKDGAWKVKSIKIEHVEE